uniref:Ig-like domain-containing protein n=1 Tax=Salmo trutta TaxID=8032 RepID=A0A674BQU7_SALTR
MDISNLLQCVFMIKTFGLVQDPTSVSEEKRVVLRCRIKCTLDLNTNFIWYKNRQPVPKNDAYSNSLYLDPVSVEDSGRYSCAVKGREDLHSPEETQCQIRPKKHLLCQSVPLVKYSDANPPHLSRLQCFPGFLWWGRGSVLDAGALLVLIYWILKRSTGGGDTITVTHSVHPDPQQ